MDEPFVAGRAPVCNGPALDRPPIASRPTSAACRRVFPAVKIGLIEAYPFSSEAAIESALTLLSARGVPPAFLHIDVDVRGLRPGRDDFARDCPACASSAAIGHPVRRSSSGATTGTATPSTRSTRIARPACVADTFRGDAMPEHLVFQSWAVSATGQHITPSNLPEIGQYPTRRSSGASFGAWRPDRPATGTALSAAAGAARVTGTIAASDQRSRSASRPTPPPPAWTSDSLEVTVTRNRIHETAPTAAPSVRVMGPPVERSPCRKGPFPGSHLRKLRAAAPCASCAGSAQRGRLGLIRRTLLRIGSEAPGAEGPGIRRTPPATRRQPPVRLVSRPIRSSFGRLATGVSAIGCAMP